MSASKKPAATNAFGLRLVHLLFTNRRSLFTAIALTILSSIATAVGPRIMGYLVDSLQHPLAEVELAKLVALYATLEAARLLFTWGQSLCFQTLGQTVLQRLRLDLFSHILALPCSRLDTLHSADIGTRLSSDLAAVAALFSAGFVRVIERTCIIIVMMFSLVLLDMRLGGACLVLSLFFGSACVVLGRHLSKSYREIREKVSAFNTFISERVSGLSTLHLFNAEERELEKAQALAANLADLRYQPAKLFGSLHALSTITIAFNVTLLLIVGGSRVADGSISIGVLVTLISYVLWILWPLTSILNDGQIFISGMASARRIFHLLDEPKEQGLLNGAAPDKLSGSIRFEAVNFQYSPGVPVLQDVSLSIQAGSKVALVGPTGSGKSTIVALLLGLYQPNSGKIMIDGHDISGTSKRSLRKLIGLVQQDLFIFSGTVHENLTLWSDAHPHPPLLNISLDRELNEHGSNLSVGERQALTFARTATRLPQIWLIDEATASLDPQTESALLQELALLSAGQTVISVAHRLRSVIDADQIFVFNAGRIVERGRHAELLAKNGLYARLYELQSAVEVNHCQ
ncbi:MAG: ABC transporter ATP-binding protein/permease [Oligoflexia bacterium]|nr:ABC transporter ATP-binding protein/permease [Oligoflexia bacterium]